VLVELSVMEQRYQAVLAVVQDGWPSVPRPELFCRPLSAFVNEGGSRKTDAAAGRAATSFSGQGAKRQPRGKATLASRLTDPFTEPPRCGREGVT
jgi:hypothetical protein